MLSFGGRHLAYREELKWLSGLPPAASGGKLGGIDAQRADLDLVPVPGIGEAHQLALAVAADGTNKRGTGRIFLRKRNAPGFSNSAEP